MTGVRLEVRTGGAYARPHFAGCEVVDEEVETHPHRYGSPPATPAAEFADLLEAGDRAWPTCRSGTGFRGIPGWSYPSGTRPHLVPGRPSTARSETESGRQRKRIP